jgi:hypothetical protein
MIVSASDADDVASDDGDVGLDPLQTCSERGCAKEEETARNAGNARESPALYLGRWATRQAENASTLRRAEYWGNR